MVRGARFQAKQWRCQALRACSIDVFHTHTHERARRLPREIITIANRQKQPASAAACIKSGAFCATLHGEFVLWVSESLIHQLAGRNGNFPPTWPLFVWLHNGQM